MLNATVQRLGDISIFHLQGRLVIGNDTWSILGNALLGQADAGRIVINLAQVDRIDAWGLGALLRLRDWAHTEGVTFKLMNTMQQVERMLQLTRLNGVFEFCSLRDLFCLLQHAAMVMPWSLQERNPADTGDYEVSESWRLVAGG
jgi:anti-anti-sigma factor